MTASVLFNILIGIIILNFFKEEIISFLNAKHFNDRVPQELEDVYDDIEYKRSQKYKKTNYIYSIYTHSFSIVLTLAFFFFEGFSFLDSFVRSATDNEILQTLLYFAVLFLGSDLLTTPFSLL